MIRNHTQFSTLFELCVFSIGHWEFKAGTAYQRTIRCQTCGRASTDPGGAGECPPRTGRWRRNSFIVNRINFLLLVLYVHKKGALFLTALQTYERILYYISLTLMLYPNPYGRGSIWAETLLKARKDQELLRSWMGKLINLARQVPIAGPLAERATQRLVRTYWGPSSATRTDSTQDSTVLTLSSEPRM